MAEVSLQEIFAKLAPRDGIELIYDIFLYLMFFLAIIAMFMQSDKQMFPTILMAMVAAFAVVTKLEILKYGEFGSLAVNAAMFAVPLIVTGITKAKKSQGLTIFGGILGGIYFFAVWFFSQRPLGD